MIFDKKSSDFNCSLIQWLKALWFKLANPGTKLLPMMLNAEMYWKNLAHLTPMFN